MNIRVFSLFFAVLVVGVALGIGASRLMGDAPTQSTTATEATQASTVPLDMQDWCTEHRVPESQCTRCKPNLIAGFKDRHDWCVEHDLPESHCRICHPDLKFPQEPEPRPVAVTPVMTSIFLHPNKGDCATNHAVIQFASAETSVHAGITVETAISGLDGTVIDAPAETRFDQTKTSVLSSSLDATVLRWLLEPGDRVSAGQAIAEIQSPYMAELQAAYLQAISEGVVATNNCRRADSLHARNLISTSEFEAIKATADVAHSRILGNEGLLRAAGMASDEIQRVVDRGEVSPRWVVRASMTGALLDRRAPLGEQLPAGATLALIGDPSALWIEAHVRETDLPVLRTGQTVSFSLDGSLERIPGQIVWIAQYLDESTRTGLVRARITRAVSNARANSFGRMTVEVDRLHPPVLVPKDAVQWEGCCNVVFVQEAPDRYRPRKVMLARGDNRYYRVLDGIDVGEPVVVNGSYLLKTELRKTSLGAGCCEVDTK